MDYYYKYKKYKNKYLQQKGAARTVQQQYEDKLLALTERVEKEVVSTQLVNEILDFFKLSVHKSYDPEGMHILEDSLMTKFISDVADKKIVEPNIHQISVLIKKLNDKEYLKWYA
ncbi:putative ORFan [Tupanvirus deep ocean]|uniref:ORFan n=2 Tax=Tupanvirus TaxID=2094720 RepID=A0AC62A934_9VIRU|nr:putative ORFan [Tupanvirus deep ocean]QKU34182.1 putative ORFan [Tupanvirus deep ocean]